MHLGVERLFAAAYHFKQTVNGDAAAHPIYFSVQIWRELQLCLCFLFDGAAAHDSHLFGSAALDYQRRHSGSGKILRKQHLGIPFH